MDCTEKMAALRAKLPAEEMISQAFSAMAKAYAPYSGFKVGAALLTADGIIYQGCNIENAAYTPSNCAERTAMFKAVSEGNMDFRAIAIVGGPKGKEPKDFCAPCGVCRQVMQEFCAPDFMIYMGRGDDSYEAVPLEQLLPYGFNAAKYMSAK